MAVRVNPVFTSETQDAIDANTAGRAQAAASIANVDAFYLLVCGIFIFFMQVSGFAHSGRKRLAETAQRLCARRLQCDDVSPDFLLRLASWR